MAETDIPHNYNNPAKGQQSTVDKGTNSKQLAEYFFLRKALEDKAKETFFLPLASTIGLPKNFGKTIKRYMYIPLLDDRNKNDQGIDAKGAKATNGNLYGSSRDIGLIAKTLPVLGENGGRVNRVGFTRKVVEGSISKFGYFYDYSKEALDFDSDPELKQHMARECINGAHQISEAQLQIDLLNAAGVEVFPGQATQNNEVTGEDVKPTIVDYESLRRMEKILTENRCPLQTTIISGSTKIDTKTVDRGRIAYVSADVVPLLEDMKDKFDNKVWIPAHQYAASTTLLYGEIGSIGKFRFIEVPEMLKWAGAGKQVTANPGYRATQKEGHQHYDIYPILVVGDDSFNTIGFQTNGKSFKFNYINKEPGKETATRDDPYGETGFSSLKWYYGFLANRPERIAVLKTVAPE